MKRTTYILIGALVFVLLLVISNVLYSYFWGAERNVVYLSDAKMNSLPLSDIHAVKIVVDSSGVTEKYELFVEGDLVINSVDSLKSNCVNYSQSKYYTVAQKQDTLLVTFNLKANNLRSAGVSKYPFIIKGLHLNVNTNHTIHLITTSVERINVKVNELKTDSLFLSSVYGEIGLNGCMIGALHTAGQIDCLKVDKTTIDNLYMNLDNMRDWTAENNSVVNNMYLTGSESRRRTIGKECKQLFWNPTSEEASLSVCLKGPSELLIK